MAKGFVYLICDPVNQLYKIGVTKSLCSKRMKQLQTGNGIQLHLVYAHETNYPYRVETILHNRLTNKNILNEWYELSAAEVLSFKDMCLNIETLIENMKDNPFFSKNLR